VRIGYVPYSPDLQQPGDRRRFPYYAEKRRIAHELAEVDGDYDVVVITPRTDLVRWSRHRPGRAKVVFDLVDSYLDIPRTDPKHMLRGPASFLTGQSRTPFFSYARALGRILERADAATCATPEQARAIGRHCPNVHPILDFQTRMVSDVKTSYAAGSPLKLVWEGLGENVRWFSQIGGPLRALARERALVLHLVTAVRFKQFAQRFWTRDTARIAARFFDDVVLHPWTEDAVARIATDCDVALIPLPLDRPLEAGKPESKLVSFWKMGMPTVTSATPAYVRVMDAAGQSLYCRDSGDWERALRTLAEDEAARREAGTGGREYAEREYSEERLAAAWDAVFAGI
jgi:glycosyltransferase involved in cell wall biosynthesis